MWGHNNVARHRIQKRKALMKARYGFWMLAVEPAFARNSAEAIGIHHVQALASFAGISGPTGTARGMARREVRRNGD